MRRLTEAAFAVAWIGWIWLWNPLNACDPFWWLR